MKHWRYILALGAIFGISFVAWAGQVPNPVNADNTLVAGHFLLGNGAQRATDSGWSLVPMANGGCNANLTATSNDLVYSTASACALLPTANSSILATNGSGVPAWTTTLPGGISIPPGDCPLPTVSSVGCATAINAVSHQWISYLDTSGVFHLAQPAFSDLSGSIAASQLIAPTTSAFGGIWAVTCPTHQVIDIIPASAAAPTCVQLAFSDISGSISASQLPTPGASTLGGVESVTCPSHQYVNQVTTSGVHNCAQPAFSDLSGSIAGTQLPSIFGNPSGYQASVVYFQPNGNSWNAGSTLSANELYAVPFTTGPAFTGTKLAISIVTGSAGECDGGIYADNGGVPSGGTLVANSDGNLANSNVTGAQTISTTGSYSLSANTRYWFAWGCNSTPAISVVIGYVYCKELGGSAAGTCYTGYRSAWTYSAGSLPSTFPSGSLVSANNLTMGAEE
jgi:hypothetical protein